MKSKVILICGEAASGKTRAIVHLVEHMKRGGKLVSLCKIDCLHTGDGRVYERLGVPYLTALSEDICPDHFLISNLEELISWSAENGTPHLIIETAGLCNRCCPTTMNTLGVCLVDCTASLRTPQKLGPILFTADAVLITKTDMVSQAEREIVCVGVRELNPTARIFCVDGLTGYGIGAFWHYIDAVAFPESLEGDGLRYTMPSGVCSYCVGERRIGSRYQQGAVTKIDIEAAACFAADCVTGSVTGLAEDSEAVLAAGSVVGLATDSASGHASGLAAEKPEVAE
jgi:Ni2+-binding GTPase involved in maturation of urease and hydrogenase